MTKVLEPRLKKLMFAKRAASAGSGLVKVTSKKSTRTSSSADAVPSVERKSAGPPESGRPLRKKNASVPSLEMDSLGFTPPRRFSKLKRVKLFLICSFFFILYI